MIPIQRFDDPRLEDYRNVSDADLLRRRNLFIAEGRLVLGRAIESGGRVVSVLLNDASARALEPSLSRLPDAVPIYICGSRDFESITGFNLHRGCLALVERPKARELPDVARSSELMLVLEGVADADNVGSAFRNAAAFGAAVLLSPTCCDPLYRKAMRTSMGSVLVTPYARARAWPDDLAGLRRDGFTIAALTPAASIPMTSYMRTSGQKLALVVGTEGAGLTSRVEELADVRLRIPISPAVDSLNLATAAGIALHHFAT